MKSVIILQSRAMHDFEVEADASTYFLSSFVSFVFSDGSRVTSLAASQKSMGRTTVIEHIR